MSSFQQFPDDVSDCKPLYITDSIIIGNGEVPAIRTANGLKWALPGGKTTSNIVEAVQMAQKLDEMITPLLHQYKRKIMRL